MRQRIWGLKTCDTCRKAAKALPDAQFVDIRRTPLSDAEIEFFVERFGEALVNRRSTTWRQMDDDARAMPPARVLRDYPAVMKRPVVESGGTLYLGWTPGTRAALGL